jgi:hypothetical protein
MLFRLRIIEKQANPVQQTKKKQEGESKEKSNLEAVTQFSLVARRR